MSSRATTASKTSARRDDRSLAQLFCLVVGATLVLAGIAGFFVESAFETSKDLNGEKLILFEVNGWHNMVHLLTGAFLLAMSGTRDKARTGALIFGAAYAVVTLIGLIDGTDIFGLVPINPADNILHILLTLAAFGAYAADKGQTADTRTA